MEGHEEMGEVQDWGRCGEKKDIDKDEGRKGNDDVETKEINSTRKNDKDSDCDSKSVIQTEPENREIISNKSKSPEERLKSSETEKLLPELKLVYIEMQSVSRTMHWEQYIKCAKEGTFVSHKINKHYQTLLPRTKGFVWFRAVSEKHPAYSNDWFGNVRCSFDLVTFLENDPKVNMFLVDCAYFGYSSASRILLTYQKRYPNSKKLELHKLKYGDPLKLENGKLHFLIQDVTRDKWWGNHQTEFVIDTNTISARKLFAFCDIYAVNHSNANRKTRDGRKYVTHQCLIYNSSSRKECPSPWSLEKTQQMLDEQQGEI